MSIKNFLIRNAAKVTNRPELAKAFKNIVWLLADKFFRAGVGLLVGVWMARFLGPEQFGRFSYGIAIVGLLGVFANFGSSQLLVQKLVRNREKPELILGSGTVLQGVASGLSVLAMCVFSGLIDRGDEQTRDLLLVFSLTLLFKPAEILKTWFEANVESKKALIVDNAALVLASIVRVYLIKEGAELLWFVWSMVLEAALAAAGYVMIYKRTVEKPCNWKWTKKEVIELARCSAPLMLSGIAISIYMRIDQVMLGEMIDQEAVGIYAAALKISELWYFMPVIVIGTAYPKLVENFDKNKKIYTQRIEKLFSVLVAISFFVAIIVTIFSPEIVTLIYGENYHQAVGILRVHVWTGIFVCLGVASSGWYINEGLQKLLLHRTVAGALVNVALNFMLIPKYGALGAAMGTLLAQSTSGYLFDLTNKKTRDLFFIKTTAFSLRNIYIK